jgi:tetratricopeptide (TPR) repeat protein
LGSLRGLVAHPELVPVALGTLGLLMHFGLDIDARYPALLSLVGVFAGLIYAQRSHKWEPLGWKWPAVAAMVLVPIVSIYFSETWATRGQTAQADGDYAMAAEDYARAGKGIVFNPDYVSAEGINLLVLGSLGGPDKAANLSLALERARAAQRLDTSDGQHYQLEGRILAAKGDYKAAEAALRQALARDKFNHPDYALDLGGIMIKENKSAEALQIVQAMLAQYPAAVASNRVADETLPPTLANLEAMAGNIYLGEGKVAEAKAAAEAGLKLDAMSLRSRALKHQVELILAPAPQQ